VVFMSKFYVLLLHIMDIEFEVGGDCYGLPW